MSFSCKSPNSERTTRVSVLTLCLELCFLGTAHFASGFESAAVEGSGNLNLQAVLFELWRLSDRGPFSILKWMPNGSGKVLDTF